MTTSNVCGVEAEALASRSMVEAVGLSHHYEMGSHRITALSDVNLSVDPGVMIAVQGRSGSGKTTLLNMLGGLDRPDQGRVMIDGAEITGMNDEELRAAGLDSIVDSNGFFKTPQQILDEVRPAA